MTMQSTQTKPTAAGFKTGDVVCWKNSQNPDSHSFPVLVGVVQKVDGLFCTVEAIDFENIDLKIVTLPTTQLKHRD